MASNQIFWLVHALARLFELGTTELAYSLVNLTPCWRLFWANIQVAGSNKLAGWQLASLSSYPVRAQQDTPSLGQFNSTQPPFKSLAVPQSVRVHHHISASKACFAADLGFKEIHVDALASNVMVGAGGAAGPAPDICHQPPG